jgi:RND family efflux transporter MFP subunit
MICGRLLGSFLALIATSCGRSEKEVSSPSGSSSTKVPVVAVAQVTRENLRREIVFDAEFRPSQDVELHARVAGFVRQIGVDIGDRVTEGQVIAETEIPEFEEEVQRAFAVKSRADADLRKAGEDIKKAASEVTRLGAALKRAEVAHAETGKTYQRLLSVSAVKPGLVAQQELDLSEAREQTAAATVDEAHAAEVSSRAGMAAAEAGAHAAEQSVLIAQSDVARLEAKRLLMRITAPFNGIITKRFADVGDSIRGGLSPSAPAIPLVRLVATDKLRLAFAVSSSHVTNVKVGTPILIYVPNLDRELSGTISRVAGEIDPATRSMEAQAEVLNNDGSLLPGMYANVRLILDQRDNVLTVPLTALSRGTPRTVTLVSDKGVLEERIVKLGLETAMAAEIVSGIGENDLVVLGSRSQLQSGQSVETKIVQALKTK